MYFCSKIDVMNKKCEICGNNFESKKQESTICSDKCFKDYLNSEEFDRQLEDILQINSEENIKRQLKINFHKLDLYSAEYGDSATKFIKKLGQAEYDAFIKSLLNNQDEKKGDNI